MVWLPVRSEGLIPVPARKRSGYSNSHRSLYFLRRSSMDQSALLSCTVQTNPAPGLLLSNLRMMMISVNVRTRVSVYHLMVNISFSKTLGSKNRSEPTTQSSLFLRFSRLMVTKPQVTGMTCK